MARHTSFTFTAVADEDLVRAFTRHAGAARFGFNQCHRLVTDAIGAKKADPAVKVPWSGFDLIRAINSWKKTGDAGRVWAVDAVGSTELVAVGLVWRDEVCAQVFEESAVDLGRALDSWSKSRRGERNGHHVGFPRRKRKGHSVDSFRLRNKLIKTPVMVAEPVTGKRMRKKTLDPATGKKTTVWQRDPRSGQVIEKSTINVGFGADPRVICLPTIGAVPVVENTRRLRRLLKAGRGGRPRARILFATVRKHRGRWKIRLNIEAPDLHKARRHQPRAPNDSGGWVGIDVGAKTFALGARSDGEQVYVSPDPLRPLTRSLPKLKMLSKAASRKEPHSKNRRKADERLNRLHGRIADQRSDYLHRQSTELVKTHDRICVENLAVANLRRRAKPVPAPHRPGVFKRNGAKMKRSRSRAISDLSWAAFTHQVAYKTAWVAGEFTKAPRFFPSTKTCSGCGHVKGQMTLEERTYRCEKCGLVTDRDLNAAVNLAAWAEAERRRSDTQAPDRQAGGRDINACGGIRSGRHRCDGETEPATPPSSGKKQETRERPA